MYPTSYLVKSSLISVFLISFSCTDSSQKVSTKVLEELKQLSELPDSIANKLTITANSPLLISRVLYNSPSEPELDSVETCINRVQRCLWTNHGTIFFPQYYCSPVAVLDVDLGQEVEFSPSNRPVIEVDVPVDTVFTKKKLKRTYKLSSLNNQRLSVPLFCWAYYGPWLIEVIREEDCCTRDFNFIVNIFLPDEQIGISYRSESMYPLTLPDGAWLATQLVETGVSCADCRRTTDDSPDVPQ